MSHSEESDGLDWIRQLALDPDRYDSDLLHAMRDDAAKWAAAFCAIAKRQGHDIDEGWMISWFANAIEHSNHIRRSSKEQESSTGTTRYMSIFL